jgi:glucose-6-phosphate 1-dehydrogenase
MTDEVTPAAAAPAPDAYYCEMPSDPCAIVMFGASGDLAKRKLLPALYDLAAHSCLAPRFQLVGFARTQMDENAFRDACQQALKDSKEIARLDDNVTAEFLRHVHYFNGSYDDPASFQRLKEYLERLDAEAKLGGNRLFYVATPPEVYPRVVEQLGRAGLAKPRDSRSWVRIIIEKPFGHDAESARQLNQTVLGVFEESQVYRIDHYLGKETVQNLLVFRFGNGIFEPLWNQKYVSHVEITAAETLGVERRAAFYESAGALRDMVQSHVLQLTSLVALEPPATFDATSVRNEKLKVLQSIRPFTPELVWSDAVRGQYGPGSIGGKAVPGYLHEPGVNPLSATETFVALRLFVDNWRWAGVPFYLRTGKRLAQSITEVVIHFREAPHRVFRGSRVESNRLVLNIQPDEGISLSFGAKPPGAHLDIRSVNMDFCYRTSFGPGSHSAYATLINDCLRGDATLFDRADSVEAAWALVDPILQAWAAKPPSAFPNYAAGEWGPREGAGLLASDGYTWTKA